MNTHALRLGRGVARALQCLYDAGPDGLAMDVAELAGLLEAWGLADFFTDENRVLRSRIRISASGGRVVETLLQPKGPPVTETNTEAQAITGTPLPTIAETETRTLFVHDKAGDVIKAMFEQCDKIKATYGAYDEYVKAVTSLHWCLAALVCRTGFGRKAWVTKEHDDIGLSLYVQEESGFVFGIIWFRDRSQDGTDREGIAGDWSCHS